jgi:hypothetical protein
MRRLVMTRRKRWAMTAGVFLGVLILGHAWNAAQAKIAYLKVDKGGAVKVTYDHGDSYSLDVYVPPFSPYGRPWYWEYPCSYGPGYVGYPYYGYPYFFHPYYVPLRPYFYWRAPGY